MKRISAFLTAATMFAAISPQVIAEQEIGVADEGTTTEITYNYDGENHTRQMEKLNRGLVAVKTNDGVFLSWRLLGDEASVSEILKAPNFIVYKNGKQIDEVQSSTNYLDKSGSVSDEYSVSTVDGEQCGAVKPWNDIYKEFSVRRPAAEEVETGGDPAVKEFNPTDISCGDLDGDGEYELVVKWVNQEIDVGDGGYAGTVHLDAYELDGTPLWQKDIALGKNIYSSAHTLQFLVYDFDGDGKAEVICQTSLGSKDGTGEYVTKCSSDSKIAAISDSDNVDTNYRKQGNNDRITTGEEFLTVFEGETGVAKDTINLPTARVSVTTFGDDFGNRCNRFTSTVASLDGVRPYAVILRGYYFGRNGQQRTSVCGVSYKDGRLESTYNFDTLSGQPGYTQGNEQYVGQGNHNITMADVDDDGKDEVITGALCLEVNDDNKFVAKWCTYLEHGDALHIGDYDPTHHGLEFFTIHEDGGGTNTYGGVALDFGASVIDPATGEIIKHWSASKDTGRGLMANVGAGGYYQIAAAAGVGGWYCMGGSEFVSGTSIGTNFRIFWDGDLYDEILDGTNVSSWNGRALSSVFNASNYGCSAINGTKNNPGLQADLFGDWREELVYPSSDGSKLCVFTTTDLTDYKLPTLMHDPVYRSGVASEQSAYNQPPHIGFYLADEIFKPKVVAVEIKQQPDKTIYSIGAALDLSGMIVTALYDDGNEEEISNYIVTGYDAGIDGTQTINVVYGQMSAEFTIRVSSGFTVDENGLITGYAGSGGELRLPASVDGVTVKGFADGALKDSGITKLTIQSTDVTEFGNDVFPNNITLVCYEGSEAYVYAQEHGIKCETVDNRDYSVNFRYSEDDFNNWYMLQGTSAQTKTIGHIQYGVGSRRTGGDGNSGFYVTELDGEKILSAGVGRFYNNNRQAYMKINDTPSLSDSVDSIFETDIMFPSNNGREARAVLTDDTGAVIDTIAKAAMGLENDKWYTYKLICHEHKYYRVLCEKGETADFVYIAAAGGSYSVSRIDFYPASGTSIGNNQSANIYFDNTRVYTNTELSNVEIRVTNSDGAVIASPKLTINGNEYIGSKIGVYNAVIPTGIYSISVEKEGYDSHSFKLSAYKPSITHEVVLEPSYVELEGIEFANSEIAFKAGQSTVAETVTVPRNASEQGIIYSSSDSSVVKVDENGKLTAVSAGTAIITARSTADEAKRAECKVTVYDDYESTLKEIKITGPSKAYIPSSGVANNVRFTAIGIDQNNVMMTVNVTWSASDKLVIDKNGVLSIPVGSKAGSYTIKAVSGDISAEYTVELVSYIAESDIIAEEKLETKFNIQQRTADTTETVGDITYHSGSRGGGGEYATGFSVSGSSVEGKSYLEARMGQWASSEREAFLVFDKVKSASAYNAAKDYILESDLYFGGGDGSGKIQLTDFNGNAVLQLEAAMLGLDAKKWYHYMLIYSGGEYKSHVFDAEGNELEITQPAISGGGMVAQMHFLKGNTNAEVIYLSGLKYYAADSAYSDISIRVKDETGAIAEGAEVKLAGKTEVTNSFGIARFTIPLGAYTVTVAGKDGHTAKLNIISSGAEASYETAFEPLPEPVSEIESVDGNKVVINVAHDNLKVYMVKYNADGSLETVLCYSPKQGTRKYTLAFSPDKVFVWGSNMKAVDSWTK